MLKAADRSRTCQDRRAHCMSCLTHQGHLCLLLSLRSLIFPSVVENCSAQVPSTDTQTHRAWPVGTLCPDHVCFSLQIRGRLSGWPVPCGLLEFPLNMVRSLINEWVKYNA